MKQSLNQKIKKLQAELSLYRKGFCEAHQPLPEGNYKGCYCCDLVHLQTKNQKLKNALRKICASKEIMEARRFAREALEALNQNQEKV